MSRFHLLLGFCAFLGMSSFEGGYGLDEVESAASEKNYKKAIQLYQEMLEKKAKPPKDILKGLVIAYWRDQEAEKAFKAFLEGIEQVPLLEKGAEMTPEEKRIYEKALADYLNLQENPQKIAVNILKSYASVLAPHPDYAQLGYLVAAAYANQGDFERFFCTFLDSYERNPYHFMAYKAKALLHIKLYERARTIEEHEVQRKQILEQLQLSIEAYPKDHTLYKMALLFAPENELSQMLDRYLNKIIDINMIIPRMDIAFYMQRILATGQFDLGKRFLNKANEWYTQSKVIDEFRKRLKQLEA
ncbi:hypothetical protein [Parachlamydia sp. AcF125]|uniref:hypothetical protein n=1 Tax=Parachlamydia sp. AcF125 TaxID=2795736 RepID=UPI001BD868EE|nr:hypothetical protein [Parachlamydia sp. AcF125]MBS4168568.1 Photosystem I assembly protein Ycf3 [Parachlamydia sp. AcF125]